MTLRHATILAAVLFLSSCMSEERLTEALALTDPAKEAAEEQAILGWMAGSEEDPILRFRAVETLVTLHARGQRPERDEAVSKALRSEYRKPHLEAGTPEFAEDSRRLRAWILYQAGALKDPRWVPFLLHEAAEALAPPADDGRGAAALHSLAGLLPSLDEDEETALQVLRLAAIAASRPDDPRLAQAGPLIAFLREGLSRPQRLAGLLTADEDAAVHAVLVRWGASALHEACEGAEAPTGGAFDLLLDQLVAEETGRSEATLAAVARVALAAHAPLHLVQGMAQRLTRQPDLQASYDLAAALVIANEVRAAHAANVPTASVWTHAGKKLCNEAVLTSNLVWQGCRRQAVQVLLASVTELAGQPAKREALLGSLANVAPVELATWLVDGTTGAAPTPADHPRLEQVARHLHALLPAPGVDQAAILGGLARLAAIDSDPIHHTAAAALAGREPAAYLNASAPLLARLPTVSPVLADALIDATVAALQAEPDRLDGAARTTALTRLAGTFLRLGPAEDSRQDRAWACLAPRNPGLLARSLAALLATRIAAQGPSAHEVLLASAAVALVRDPAQAESESPLLDQLTVLAGRDSEELALFATRALAEQGSPASLACLRRLAEAKTPLLPSVSTLVGAALAALANQAKP